MKKQNVKHVRSRSAAFMKGQADSRIKKETPPVVPEVKEEPSEKQELPVEAPKVVEQLKEVMAKAEPTHKVVGINREFIKSKLMEICEHLTTKYVSVEFTEDTRKLDAGIVYYIVHIKKPDARKTATRKTGVYFTKMSNNTVHVQVINGTSLIVLFSNYSDNSQEDVFKYLEAIVRKDMEFYQNSVDAKKPVRYKTGQNNKPTKSYGEGRRPYGRAY